MIKPDTFYQGFDDSVHSTARLNLFQRSRGRILKDKIAVLEDTISLWFKVSGKASAIPYQRGEFWPVIEVKTMHHGTRDDGLIAWYQYTDKEMGAAIVA